MADRYPGAIWTPSIISHPNRPQTLGIVIHWTAGGKALTTLQGKDPGHRVDVQFLVGKEGNVYQFVPTDSQAWHGFSTANTYMVGIEHEGAGEPWTESQFAASAALCSWLCNLYAIPVVHCDPSGHTLSTFRGICGHRDLSVGGERVDGNNHTDTVPDSPGWDAFLEAVRGGGQAEAFYFEHVPYVDGGLGPTILGQKIGYADKATRDEKLELIEIAHPELPLSTMKGDDGRYYILGWGGDSQHGAWYRSQGFALEADRDREWRKRVKNSKPHPVRRFRGKANSAYPWPA